MAHIYLDNRNLEAISEKFLPEKFRITSEGGFIKLTITQVFFFEIQIDVYLAVAEISESSITLKSEKISYEKMGIGKFIKNIEDKVNKEVNRKIPGLLFLSYPYLKIDLSKVRIKQEMSLADLITITNVEINDSIKISFDTKIS